MKRIIICMLLVCAVVETTNACTACGCSASNQYMGLLPQMNNNFIGFQFISKGFSTNLPDDGGGDPFGLSNDNYSTFQIWGRYSINKRIQIFAFIPYIYNVRKLNGESSVISGISDMTVMGNYRMLDKDNGAWKHTLLIGGGLKMPTGKYDSHSIQYEEGLPNMQPGTHSWDVIGDINYTISHQAIGMNVDLCYVYTTANSDSYKFGNRRSAGISGFYRVHKNDVTLLPQVGLRYDHAEEDYTNFANRVKDDMSGGWQIHAAAGVQAYYKQWGVQFMYNQPLDQHYASGLVNMNHKIETGILFLF